jgi:hypothetical protein
MNLESLARTVGGYVRTLDQDKRDSIAGLIDYLIPVGEAVDALQKGIIDVANAFSDAVEGVDGDEASDYHCWTCKMNDAPVEELDLADMLRYIERYHDKPGVATYATYLLSQDPERVSWSGTNIVKWYEQARDASNPSQWDRHRL